MNPPVKTRVSVPTINLHDGAPALSPAKSGRPASTGSSRRGENLLKEHKFRKVAFKQPTWCLWSNKFIWGLDKTGFECVDCQIPVSRKFLSAAKLTLCEGLPTLMTVRTGDSSTSAKPVITGSKIFTIHLPEGQRRSVMFNPHQKLSEVISKICRDRDWQISDYIACDSNGTELDVLRVLLGQIKSLEITFTKREAGSSMMRPPLLSDVRAKLEAQGLLSKGRGTAKRHTKSSSDNNLSVIKQEDDQSKSDEASGVQESEASQSSQKVTRHVKECYTIAEKELGSGAFSIVLAGTDKQTGESVAIKVIERSEAGDSAEQAAKFKQEFEIHSSLLHDHIVHFVMMDETDDQYFVVMELVSGGELFDQVIDRGQFEEKDACTLICQVLTGLAYMHKKGIAHRDLKPENLLFKDKKYDCIKIADFGESKACLGKSLLTYCGTPDYMAPEIIQAAPYGTEVDMWALGCIAYIMMAGFPPFDGENDAEVLASILSVRYDFPTPEWDDYSQESKDFISGLLIGDGSKRMTAQQALDHPWIKKHCKESQRNIPGKEPPPIEEKIVHVQTPLHTPGSARKGVSSRSRSTDSRGTIKGGFDGLELAYFQTPFEEGGDPKSLVLRGIEILTNCAYYRASSFIVEELIVMLSIVNEIPDSSRTDFENFILKTYWTRLQTLKGVLSKTGKEKDKKKTLSKNNKKILA